MIYWELFWGFLRVGCFSFGGGYGSIPLIRDVVLSHGWLSEDALTYMIAISESTPGPIMVNLATYIGSSQAGILGAALATLAVVFPAFLIILLVMAVLAPFMRKPAVQATLRGIKPCVTGIILAVGLHMVLQNLTASAGNAVFTLKTVCLTAILAFFMFGSGPVLKKKISSIQLILLSAILGIIVYN